MFASFLSFVLSFFEDDVGVRGKQQQQLKKTSGTKWKWQIGDYGRDQTFRIR